jgi:hypothetical protein
VNLFAARYVLLGLRLGRIRDGLVDGYFGPPELADLAAEGDVPAIEELHAEALALRHDLADADLDPQRRRWLAGQLEALVCVAELEAGEDIGWVETVRRCYGIDVGPMPEERFEEAHALLDKALPGSGDLACRLKSWNETQRVPPEKLLDAFEALTAELRRRTALLVDLPAGEGIEAELVSGMPWGAYNWYLGGLRSRIQINTDLPIHAHRLAGLAAHEGYPGHHTEHACKEAALVRDRGHVEAALLLIHTPECLVSEGIAEVALEQALGADWPVEVAEILAPLGIDVDAAVAGPVAAAQEIFDDVSVNVSYFAREEGWGEHELVAYYRRWTLSEEHVARKRLEFATHPFWSPYTPTYVVGPRLVGAYLERHEDGLRKLLTEELTTADLTAEPPR